MKKLIIGVVLIIVLVGAYQFLTKPGSNGESPIIVTSSGVWYRNGTMLLTNPPLPVTVGGAYASSTTATSATLLASELVGYNIIRYTPNTASTTLTLTASSSLTAMVPNSGQSTIVKLKNATTTAGVNLTVVAGTGTTLRKATSTDAIPPGGVGILEFIRLPNTDMDVLLDISV